MFVGRRTGFTLIELLIVIGLFAVLASASFPLYGNMQTAALRQSTVDMLADMIRLSVAQSMVSAEPVSVIFQSDQAMLFVGSSFEMRDTRYDRVVVYEDLMDVRTTFPNNVFIGTRDGLGGVSGTVHVVDQVTGQETSFFVTSLGIILYE